jgi:hypothetical protein
MSQSQDVASYSFSMMNLVKLLAEWSWDGFDQLMSEVGTMRVEVVPSFCFGMDWDQKIEDQSTSVYKNLEYLRKHYTVGSIQSLTYGLDIQLADQLINHPGLLRRLQALKMLGTYTKCSVFILGSPAQKKLLDPSISNNEHKQHFMANCSWMASILGPDLILSLEHNTREQGAEYCNTFADIVDIVSTLRCNGVHNVGINLDTKCLIQEFGEYVRVGELLLEPSVSDLVTSVQVSLDFLIRNTPYCADDHKQLRAFACVRDLPLSLEEFGLLPSQLHTFLEAWGSQ